MIEKFRPFDLKPEKEQAYNNINKDIRYTARRKVSQDETVNNQRNGWGLFNQLNYAIGRNVSGTSQIQKRITANKRAENYLAETLITV